MFINRELRQIDFKIVYFGPPTAGITTILQWLEQNLPLDSRSTLLTLKIKGERGVFLDYLMYSEGVVNGLKIVAHLYACPPQTLLPENQYAVLNNADAVIFVADSSCHKMQDNLTALINLIQGLSSQQHIVEEFPIVIQYNKRDLLDPIAVDYLKQNLNRFHAPDFETSAITGAGIKEALNAMLALLAQRANKALSLQ